MKDTLTKDELDDFFETLKMLIMDLEICISNIEKIVLAHKTKPEKIHTVNHFLGHYVYLAYAYSALNIYKMYKGNEKRSFKKLFNKLENFNYSIDLKQILESNRIDENADSLFTNRTEIKNEITDSTAIISQVETIVEIINNRRSSFYAHHDPDKKFPPEKLKDLKAISMVSQKVFDRLHGKFYNSTFFFNNYHWTVEPVLAASEFHYDYYKKLEDDLDKE